MKHRILSLGGAALLAASLWGIGGPAQAADNLKILLPGVPPERLPPDPHLN